jgi:hypothetical protein
VPDRHFYVLVRKDLPLAQQLVQAVHAAHEAGIRFGDPERISSTVLCSVPDEPSLLQAKERLDSHGIKSSMFIEPDIGNKATALATEPLFGKARKVMSSFPLWGKEA